MGCGNVLQLLLFWMTTHWTNQEWNGCEKSKPLRLIAIALLVHYVSKYLLAYYQLWSSSIWYQFPVSLCHRLPFLPPPLPLKCWRHLWPNPDQEVCTDLFFEFDPHRSARRVYKLEHKTCDILAAERLRLMRFENRLIIAISIVYTQMVIFHK